MKNLAVIGLITIAKISSALIAMVAAVVAAHLLSVGDFGAISMVLSAAVIFAALVDWGASIYVRKRSNVFAGSINVNVRKMLGWIVIGLLVRGVVISVGVLALLWIIYPSAPLIYFMAAPIGVAFALEVLTGELLRARRKYMWAEYYSGGMRQTLYVAVLLLAGAFSLALGWIAVLYTVSMLVATLVSVTALGGAWFTRASLRLKTRNASASKQRRHFVLTGLLNILLNQLPLLFAGFFASHETAGVVRVSLLFGLLMQMAISANAMFFAPKFSSTSRNDNEALVPLLTQSSRFGLLAIPAGLIGIVLCPFVISLLFGPAYDRSVFGAQLLVAVYSILSVFGAYGQFVLLRGGERIATTSAVVAVASQLALLPVLTLIWPVEGFVAAYGASMFILYGYLGVFGYRATGIAPGPKLWTKLHGGRGT